MRYIVVSHRNFTFRILTSQDLENAIKKKCDSLAWSKEVRKRYQSSAKKDGKIKNSKLKVFKKLKSLEEKGKAKYVPKSKIEAKISQESCPLNNFKNEYVVFIKLAEVMNAEYLVTEGEMLNLLRDYERDFRFTPCEADYFIQNATE